MSTMKIQERSFISSSIPAATAYAVFISQLMLLVGITTRKLHLKGMNLISTLVRSSPILAALR